MLKIKFTQQAKLILFDFFENPTQIKKDFIFKIGFTTDYAMQLLNDTSQRNVDCNKVYKTCMDYLSTDLIADSKNNNKRAVILNGLTQIYIKYIVNSPVWNNPDPVFNNKISKNSSQILYANGSGHGDEFNYLIMTGTGYTQNISKDVFMLPCLMLSGAKEDELLKIIKIFATQKDSYKTDEDSINLYQNSYNKKLSTLKNVLHDRVVKTLLHYNLSQKIAPAVNVKKQIKIEINHHYGARGRT